MSSRKVNTRHTGQHRHQRNKLVDEFETTIRDLASDGRGVAEAPDGQVLFVTGAWQGERVQVRRTRQGAKASAELLKIVEPASERASPICDHQYQCGGCPWMFVNYDAQLSAKVERLRGVLTTLRSDHIEPRIQPSPRQLGYRNRAQFKTNGKILGYLVANTHEIIDVTACPILTEQNQRHLARLRRELPNIQWRPKSRQKWVTLDIDDQRTEPLVNQRQPFRQGNDDQNLFMSEWLRQILELLAPSDGLVELFCGSGNLTSVLASCFPEHQITAVEGDTSALGQLLSLELPNVAIQQRNLFSAADVKILTTSLPANVGVILDPPRDGLKERDALAPLFSKAPWVVYISCNLATWRRDALFLQSLGLTLTKVDGLDMFPQTPHLEVLSVFERK